MGFKGATLCEAQNLIRPRIQTHCGAPDGSVETPGQGAPRGLQRQDVSQQVWVPGWMWLGESWPDLTVTAHKQTPRDCRGAHADSRVACGPSPKGKAQTGLKTRRAGKKGLDPRWPVPSRCTGQGLSETAGFGT